MCETHQLRWRQSEDEEFAPTQFSRETRLPPEKSSQLLNGAQIFTFTRVTFLSLLLSHPGFFRRHSETSLLFSRKVKDLENVNSVSGVLPSGLACRD